MSIFGDEHDRIDETVDLARAQERIAALEKELAEVRTEVKMACSYCGSLTHRAPNCIGTTSSAAHSLKALTARCAVLESALTRAHDKLRLCVTAGVLRHDINVFLAAEAEALAPEVPHGA